MTSNIPSKPVITAAPDPSDETDGAAPPRKLKPPTMMMGHGCDPRLSEGR